MKIIKKVSAVCAVTVCSASLLFGGAAVSAATEIDETTKSTIESTAEGLTETIIPLTDDEIETYLESDDDFTVSAMNAWKDAKDELGDMVEIGSVEIKYSSNQYTATVPVDFEKLDAEFEYIFDSSLAPTSVAVNVQYPMSTLLKNAALNTVMGLGTVFAVLAVLIFLISLFKYIPGSSAANKKKEEQEKAPVSAAASAPVTAPAPAPVSPEMDNGELVAVIAAAIAAAEGTTTDGFVVRSIRKVRRPRR